MINNLRIKIKVINKILIYSKIIHGTYFFLIMVNSFFKSFSALIAVIFPKVILDSLVLKKDIKNLIIFILLFTFTSMMIGIVTSLIDNKINIANIKISDKFDLKLGEKVTDINFEDIENPDILNLKESAIFPIKNQNAIIRLVTAFSTILVQILNIIVMGAVLLYLDKFMIIIITLFVFLSIIAMKYINDSIYDFHNNLIPINRKFSYFSKIMNDFSFGKEIRINQIQSYILKIIGAFNSESLSKLDNSYTKVGRLQGFVAVIEIIQKAYAYFRGALLVIKSLIGIGDFMMLVNSVNAFSKSLRLFFENLMEISQMARYLEKYCDFNEIRSKADDQGLEEKNMSINDSEIAIEFKDVSFKYPRSDSYVLKNINIKLKKNSKIALVGKNGAGKTTFIKLLLRLYEPLDGTILVDGIDIKNYNYKQYFKKLAVIFQDFKLFAYSIRENIALGKFDVNDEVIKEILVKVNFFDDLNRLDQGLDTSIYRIFDTDGIELSGGMGQKVAIARATYKNSDIMILDEPTAALDAISESEINNNLNFIVKGKTTIYISHRLSSCTFCDKIIVFDNGEIRQCGNHKTLMESNGFYREMFTLQAKNYVDI